MKNIIKKYSIYHIVNVFAFAIAFILLLLVHDTIAILALICFIIGIITTSLAVEFKLNEIFKEKILEKEKEYTYKREMQFQESLKNIYDEHIFSITHELRTPLAVINSCLHNGYHNLKMFYNDLTPDQKLLLYSNFKHSKQNIKTIASQVDIVQNFISSISEYASYVSDKNQNIINLQTYLLSIIINSHSYSRNMKIFGNDGIGFLNSNSADFENIHCIIKPHDLTRMLINIMTNSSDAIAKIYKSRKLKDPGYHPELKIRCIKSKNPENKILLNKDFLRINGQYNDAQSFYLVIEDNGPGISNQHINKIFQYGISSKKDDESDCMNIHHGLGLYITLKLAELNDIKIYIKTSHKGTMVVLGLPNIKYNSTTITNDSKALYLESVENELYNSQFQKIESNYHKILTEKGLDEDTKSLFKKKDVK